MREGVRRAISMANKVWNNSSGGFCWGKKYDQLQVKQIEETYAEKVSRTYIMFSLWRKRSNYTLATFKKTLWIFLYVYSLQGQFHCEFTRVRSQLLPARTLNNCVHVFNKVSALFSHSWKRQQNLAKKIGPTFLLSLSTSTGNQFLAVTPFQTETNWRR